jgi:PKD repeat protein
LGIALDPDYPNTPEIYLWYTYGQAANEGDFSATMTRLIRVTEVDGVGDRANYVILLGRNAADSIPVCYNTHAIGSVKFGHDGSLIASIGEGGHWDFDLGDYGQDVIASDASCAQMFGDDQDIGSFRSQSLRSGGGKILRLDPRTGQGICQGNDRFGVANPFCDGNLDSWASKTWALGARQPFRMMIRPLMAGDAVQGPGTIYFGDVGEGGYEEVNVVNAPGLNFGWPCWEGPLPMVKHRDSPLNLDPNSNVYKHDPNILCPYIYANVVTTTPFFFYSRYGPGNPLGNYRDNGYLGQGFIGNTISGIAFYTGTNYPAAYQNSLFVLDYGQMWIRALKVDTTGGSDIFQGVMDFINVGKPITTLEIEPEEGNLVYLTLFDGAVRMLKYVGVNNPPVAQANAFPSSGVAPLSVQFTADGSIDKLGNPVTALWDFGDGSETSREFNPVHVYQTSGVYTVALSITNDKGITTSTTLTVNTQFAAPVVNINAPTTNDQLWHYDVGQNVNFAATVQSTAAAAELQYSWSATLAHENHFHPDAYTSNSPTFSAVLSDVGSEVPSQAVRVNMFITLAVTDVRSGLIGYDSVFVAETPGDWFENTPPVPDFSITSGDPMPNKPIQFDASATVDNEYDSIFYTWDFGDGLPPVSWGINDGFFNPLFITHTYNETGIFTVTLTATDNYLTSKSIAKAVAVGVASPDTPTTPSSPQNPTTPTTTNNPSVVQTPIDDIQHNGPDGAAPSGAVSICFNAILAILCIAALM